MYKRQVNGTNSNSLDWAALKELSSSYKDAEPFDIYDLLSFYKFFNSLYNQKCDATGHPNLEPNQTSLGRSKLEEVKPVYQEALTKLNRQFTMEELVVAISKLHNNKSASVDLISNEMLKGAKFQLREVILKLFNACLDFGVYP